MTVLNLLATGNDFGVKKEKLDDEENLRISVAAAKNSNMQI